jgi:hypothetical protein
MVQGKEYSIPLAIGVRGCRTVDEADDRLVRVVTSELRKLRDALPHTPFVVLSPLAEGAERLLARLAIAHLSAKLIVPLPLPLEEYQKEFTTEHSRQAFTDLFREAESWFAVPKQEQRDAVRLGREEGDRQYAGVDAYVAAQCQILIAFWDGRSAKEPGGTADGVRWNHPGGLPAEFSLTPEDHYLFAAPTRGLVLHINPVTYEVGTIPANPNDRGPSAVLAKIDEFNQEVQAYRQTYGDEPLLRSKQDLVQVEESNELLHPRHSFQNILPLYAAADRLAQHYQKRNRTLTRLIYAIFTVAVLFYGLIDLVPYWVLFYVAAMPVISALLYWARKRAIEDRAIDYRALAEGLRILAFWRLCGIQERVSANYLSKHAGPLSWIRQALRQIETVTVASAGREESPATQSAIVLTKRLWVDAQIAYLSARQKTCILRARRFHAISRFSFVGTFFLACAFGFYLWRYGPQPPEVVDRFQAALGFVAAIGVAAEAYKSKQAYEELAKQYALLRQIFVAAGTHLSGTAATPERILVQLGKEALMENGEWLWLERNLPLEMPRG